MAGKQAAEAPTKTVHRRPKSKANGEGSIYKRNRTIVAKDGSASIRTYWYAEIAWVDHDDRPQKKQIQRTSERAAKDALARLKDEIRAGRITTGADASRSVEEVMNAYLDDAALRVRPNTIDTYRTIVKHHVTPRIGHRRANSLRRSHVVAWLNDLEGKDVGGRLRQVAYRLLKAATGPYLTHVPPREHPFPMGKGPRSSTPEMTVWTADEVRAFLAEAAKDRYHAVYVLALSAGLRQGEILALRWRDVGGEAVVVRGTLDRKTRIVGEPKTSTGRRVVAVSNNVIKALSEHRAQQQAKGHPVGPDDFVFTAKSGRPVGVKNLYHHSFVPLMKEAEVPRISFHALRHTSASLLLAAGVNLKVIQERLGHRDVSTLLRRYAHLMPSAQSEAAGRIDHLFSPSSAPDHVRGHVREPGASNGRKRPASRADRQLSPTARQSRSSSEKA